MLLTDTARTAAFGVVLPKRMQNKLADISVDLHWDSEASNVNCGCHNSRCVRYLFWTNCGRRPKIERAQLDGSADSRRAIVTTNIHCPVGLTIGVYTT